MTIVKDRPLSEAQEFALSAMSQHGYIVRSVGGFLNTPYICQVQQRTIDSLAKRGYGKPGVVRQGDLELPALLRQDVTSPVVLTQTQQGETETKETATVATPSFTQNDERGVHSVQWDGYRVAMYRSPNSGDMVFDIEKPEDTEIQVFVEDHEVFQGADPRLT